MRPQGGPGPRLRAKLAPLAIAAGLVVTATTAYGASQASGHAFGSVQAMTAHGLVVTHIAVLSDLYPGGKSDLLVSVANPNPYPVTVVAIHQDGDISGAGGIGRCNGPANVSYTNQAGSWVLAANDGLDITLPDAVQMVDDADNGCQSATFTVPVEVRTANSASDPS